MSSRPANAWFVLAAWAGLMAGVGAALRPTPSAALPPIEAEALAAAWQGAIARERSGRPMLLLGDPACPCEDDTRRTLAAWARSEAIEVRPAPDLAGIALADAEGRLRYAGDPGALAVHCGGLRGFRAWWTASAERPVLTAPCPCG